MELMKDPEKFATMVVKQSGSGTGGIWNLLSLNVMKESGHEDDGKHLMYRLNK